MTRPRLTADTRPGGENSRILQPSHTAPHRIFSVVRHNVTARGLSTLCPFAYFFAFHASQRFKKAIIAPR